jgi:hypothetical protein
VCTCHPTPLLTWPISRTLFQLPTPLILLGDFNVWHHLWGSVDEDEMWRVIQTLITRGNLVVLNILSLASGNLSCLDLTMCSPAISADFTWRLLDLCGSGSDHFLICLSLPSSVLQEDRNPNWVVKQADWPLFSQLAIIEETAFRTLDSMVDKFMSIMRAYEQSIPKSSIKPQHVPVPWWMKECRDAILAWKHALRNFRRHPTEANPITFKRLHARAQRIVRQSKRRLWEKFVSCMSNSVPSTIVWERLQRIWSKCSCTFIPALSVNGATVTSQDEVADTL